MLTFESETECVVVGRWRDLEYIELQKASMYRTLSKDEMRQLVAGPRRHPYGADAVEVNVDGEWVVFPDKEAASG